MRSAPVHLSTTIHAWRVRLVLAAVLAVALPAPAFACSCMWAGPFTTVAPGQPVIVLAEVLGHDDHGMDVKVLEVLKGADRRPTIRIWGDTGALCRPYVSGFKVGTTWLFAIRPLPERMASDPPGRAWRGFQSPPGDPHYTISVCGSFWVEARDGRAVGHITAARHDAPPDAAPLAALLTWLRAGASGPAPTASPAR
jgi:hypothetical protein